MSTLKMSFLLLGAGFLNLESAQAAHWVVVSQTTSSYPSSPAITGDAVQGPNISDVVTIGSGATYGSGSFSFFGEGDSFGFDSSKPFGGSSGTYTVLDEVAAYYEFTYKWVSDSGTDVPPSAGSDVGVDGYSLREAYAQAGLIDSDTPGVSEYGPYGCLFNSSGFTGDYSASNASGYECGWSEAFPGSGDRSWHWVTISGTTFSVVPYDFGSQTVSIDGGGNTVVIFYPLNDQEWSASMNATSTLGGGGLMLLNDAQQCLLGASEIGGFPVE